MEALSYRLVECTVGGVHGNSFVIAGGPPKLAQSSSSSVIERCGKHGRWEGIQEVLCGQVNCCIEV
jgi:hypothetical protein